MDEAYEDFELYLFRAAQADLDQHALIAPVDVSDLVERVINGGTNHRTGHVLNPSHRTCRIPRQSAAAMLRGPRW